MEADCGEKSQPQSGRHAYVYVSMAARPSAALQRAHRKIELAAIMVTPTPTETIPTSTAPSEQRRDAIQV